MKSFFLKFFKNGEQIPLFSVIPSKFEKIEALAIFVLNSSENTNTVIENIKKVENGISKGFEISYEDSCEILIRPRVSIIIDPFEKEPPVELSTNELLNLLIEWKDFLLKYEKGEIPFIIPFTKCDEWMVVRRSDMKEIKWDKDSLK